MLSVLVGGAGYVLQAITARRAERVAQQHASQEHFAEMTRQREHEQMQAQILRTDAWLDECCQPIEINLGAIVVHARANFVCGAVLELESTNPDIVADMVAQSTPFHAIGSDGKVRSARSGTMHWQPREASLLGPTQNFDTYMQFGKSAAAMVINNSDVIITFLRPYVSVAPRLILDVVRDDPQSVLAQNYRRYAQMVLLPQLRRVANILARASCKIELPPMSWLQDKFKILPWYSLSNSFFLREWIGYTDAFENVVVGWQEGDFAQICPDFGVPILGLMATINWAETRGESLRRELIGMTAQAEVDLKHWERSYTTDGRAIKHENDEASLDVAT
eukprot:SAG31_NODE_2651_length_5296_cov_2.101770_7_plen_335_part_00